MRTDLVLVIGDKNLSSWSLRPWLLLRHAGIPFVERVRPFDEAGWRETIAQTSPSGRVPALHHGELVVCESLAICEYVAELHPEARLWPDDRAARAHARSIASEMHAGFAAVRKELSMDVAARFARPTLSADAQREVARVQAIWTGCRGRFGSEGPFLFGRFSIADAMYAPVVWRFRSYDVPVADGARDWYETMLALPAMKEWERDAEAEVTRAGERRAGRATPDPSSAQHCYAVIFSNQLRDDARGYEETAAAMVALAREQPGFLGIDSARGPDGFGITVSYWDSPQAIQRWKERAEHRTAQARGRESFYARYELRVALVERGYEFSRER